MSAILLLGIVQTAAQAAPRVPVVVELFSSEGCSSCPPADRVLAALDQRQPVAGVEVLALEEHVDYWNYLGWADPFSSAGFTERQHALDEASDAQVYTPQLWVNGAAEVNGAAGELVGRLIAKAAQVPLVEVAVTADASGLTATVGRLPGAKPATMFLAITERGLATKVKRGENAGRTLEHGPVVRRLIELGQVPALGGSLQAPLQLDARWTGRLRLVVFVQSEGGPIVAAGACGFGP